jgi:hypothetical protein
MIMAEAHILLEADAFAAGEQVSGSIVLTSSALITCKAVCLLLTGKEAWRLPYERTLDCALRRLFPCK